MAIDSRWNRKEVSLASPVVAVRRRPNSVKKSEPLEFMGPRVSNAKGTKQCDVISNWYFCSFLMAAPSAAPPAVAKVAEMYDSARVSVTVTSQVRQRPPCHGICVSPSGRLPSDLNNPSGSLTDGMSARFKALQTRSLMA